MHILLCIGGCIVMKKLFKGNIVFSKELGKYEIYENGVVLVEDGKVSEVYSSIDDIPEEIASKMESSEIELNDFENKIIVPGFCDLHLHAPQFANRGLGMDKELLDWLETYTFPEEAKYKDMEYAKKAYKNFVKAMWKYGTLNSIVFGTIDRESTEMLMDLMDQAGLNGFVGKVNMDRNAPDFYIEDTEESLKDTEQFIVNTKDKYERVKPIITPRFIPTSTARQMEGLAELAEKYDLKIQSHLSENRGEIEWVKELHPEADSYADVYRRFNLFKKDKNTVMAHCVWNTDDEIKLMEEYQVFVAHSPYSNTNLSSGIAPIRKYLDNNVPVGLATDVSGGHNISIPSAMSIAAQMSKMRWVHVDSQYKPLNTTELFYLATKSAGEFFGNTGSFEKGYYFDALVIDDSSLDDVNERSIEERIERFVYLGDDRNIYRRYSAGKLLEEPKF